MVKSGLVNVGFECRVQNPEKHRLSDLVLWAGLLVPGFQPVSHLKCQGMGRRPEKGKPVFEFGEVCQPENTISKKAQPMTQEQCDWSHILSML